MAQSKKAEVRERRRAALAEPTFLDDLCAFIAEGHTLSAFTRLKDLRYRDVNEWLDADESRRETFDKAVKLQAEVHKDMVMGGLVGAVEGDLAELFDATGAPLPINKIPASARRNIAGIEVTENERGDLTTKFRMVDRTKNRELLGKRYGMFVDKVDHGGTLTLAQMVAASMPPGTKVGT